MADAMAEDLSSRKFETATVTSADEAFSRLAEGDDGRRRGDGPQHARDERRRPVRARGQQPARRARDRGDGLRLAGDGGRDAARGGVRLPRPSRSTWSSSRSPWSAPPQHRRLREEVKRLRQAAEESKKFEELVGQSAAMKAGLRAHRPRRGDGRDGAHHGRDRHGQGARGAGHPSPRPAPRRTDGDHQLRRRSRRTCSRASCSATRKGAFTDARDRPQGPLRAGARRHALPRRGRRDAARHAGEAAARARGAHRAPGRRAARRSPSTSA